MKRIAYIISLSALLLGQNACMSLDQDPQDKVRLEKSFKTPEEVRYWLNGIYTLLRDVEQGEAMYVADIQADFLNVSKAENQRMPLYRDFHGWKNFSFSNQTTEVTENIWKKKFNIIVNANVALEGVAQMSQQEAVKALKGELYLTRAYCYTYLVTHYCKAYQAATASTDFGLPIFDHFVSKTAPLQSTLEQTYQFILADIAQAEKLLAATQGKAGATTFTIDAAKALKARVLLYKGEWALAYAAARDLVENTRATYPLVTSENDLQAMWADDTTAETITQLFALVEGNNIERPNGTNNLYADEFENKLDVFRPYILDPNLIPTQDFVDLFDAADWRKNVYIKEDNLSIDVFDPKMAYYVAKYPRNQALTFKDEWFPYYGHKPKLFRIAEAYLIAAEAAAHLGQDADAQRYLNQLRQARGLSTAITATGATLLQEVQNERNRELCFEGVRLHDLKRWGMGVKRGTPQDLSLRLITTEPATETYQLDLPAGYYKMVWPIPAKDIEFENGRWKQNPNW